MISTTGFKKLKNKEKFYNWPNKGVVPAHVEKCNRLQRPLSGFFLKMERDAVQISDLSGLICNQKRLAMAFQLISFSDLRRGKMTGYTYYTALVQSEE